MSIEARSGDYDVLQLGIDTQYGHVMEHVPELARLATERASWVMDEFVLDTQLGSQDTRLQPSQIAGSRATLAKLIMEFAVYDPDTDSYEAPSPILLRSVVLPFCLQRAGKAEGFEPALKTFALDMVACRAGLGHDSFMSSHPNVAVEQLAKLVSTRSPQR